MKAETQTCSFLPRPKQFLLQHYKLSTGKELPGNCYGRFLLAGEWGGGWFLTMEIWKPWGYEMKTQRSYCGLHLFLMFGEASFEDHSSSSLSLLVFDSHDLPILVLFWAEAIPHPASTHEICLFLPKAQNTSAAPALELSTLRKVIFTHVRQKYILLSIHLFLETVSDVNRVSNKPWLDWNTKISSFSVASANINYSDYWTWYKTEINLFNSEELMNNLWKLVRDCFPEWFKLNFEEWTEVLQTEKKECAYVCGP